MLRYTVWFRALSSEPPHPWQALRLVLSRTYSVNRRYPYGSLDKARREIRLLELYPGNFKDPVECSLRHVALDNPQVPRYETISYHWGDTTERSQVLINGTQVSAPISSVQALQQIRSVHSIRTVWIDALCINQGNVRERNHQVTLMGNVFRRSTGNLVVLGRDNTLTKAAFRSVYTILEEAYQESNGVFNFAATCYDAPKGKIIISDTASRVNVDHQALELLLSQAWFSRLWVFQEAALAPMNTCICGSHEIPLIDLVRAVVWILHKRLSFPAALCNSRAALQGKYLWHFIDDQSPIYPYMTGRGISLPEMWRIQRWLKCSDPHDRVYGLLGLCSFSVQNQRIPQELSPDYSKPVEDVFRSATKYMLLRSSNPGSILRYIHHDHMEAMHLTRKPTWVPEWDWSHIEGLSRLNETLFAVYKQHRHISAIPYASRDSSDLTLRGISIDNILEVSDLLDEETYKNSDRLQQWLWHVQELSFSVAMFDGTSSNPLGFTLISGENWLGQKATDDDGDGLSSLLDYLNEWQEPPPALEHADSTEPETQRASRFYHRMVASCGNRRLFVTGEGRIGAGPMALSVGDAVVALQGCATPYVLRQQEEKHLVLGECYLHGVMHGEAVSEHRSREDPDEVFVLM